MRESLLRAGLEPVEAFTGNRQLQVILARTTWQPSKEHTDEAALKSFLEEISA